MLESDFVKVCLIGDTEVGKTSVLSRLLSGDYKNNLPTIGAYCVSYLVQGANGITTRLQIWDTAGQEKYHALIPSFFRGANVAILFFDLTNVTSFQNLPSWLKDVTDACSDRVHVVVVGNKSDLEDERCVPADSIMHFVENIHALGYYEISAKTGAGVPNLFSKISELSISYDRAVEELLNSKKIIPSKPLCGC